MQLTPASNVAQALSSHAAGTEFDFAPGTYRVAQLDPQENQILCGQAGAVFDGSMVLSATPTFSAPYWSITGLPAPGTPSGQAAAATPLATHPNDLFVDGVLYTRAQSLSAVGAGSWFFDETKLVAQLTDDPTGKTVELSSAVDAIYGNSSGVTVQGLTLQKYASGYPGGALVANGAGWTIRNVLAQFNHSTGIAVFGTGCTVTGCEMNDNGNAGFGSYQSTDLTLSGNEIARNNYAGFDVNWSAGGFKIDSQVDGVVSGNFVHDNHGVGMWFDTNNAGITISGNLVLFNDYNGIMWEVSYGGTISGNVVIGNGANYASSGIIPAGVLLQNGQDVVVTNNYIEVDNGQARGVGLTYEPRGSSDGGTWTTNGNTVSSNTFQFPSGFGLNGEIAYSNLSDTSSYVEDFESNTYSVTSAGQQLFRTWGGTLDTFAQAQSAGFESGSTLNVVATVPTAQVTIDAAAHTGVVVLPNGTTYNYP